MNRSTGFAIGLRTWLILFSINVFAQAPMTLHSLPGNTRFQTESSLIVSGSVVMENGGAPPDRVAIQSDCHGSSRTEGYTDSKGTFHFDLYNGNPDFGGQDSTPGV